MKKRRVHPRIRCGRCSRILEDPNKGRRTLSSAQRAELAELSGIQLGARRYQLIEGGRRVPHYEREQLVEAATFGEPEAIEEDEHFFCAKCHRSYTRSSEALAQLREQARQRGEDIYLLTRH